MVHAAALKRHRADMAGSYAHVTNDDGTFRGCMSSESMLDHMGDANEALEQMHFMIGWLAHGNASMIAQAVTAYWESKQPPKQAKPASTETVRARIARAVGLNPNDSWEKIGDAVVADQERLKKIAQAMRL